MSNFFPNHIPDIPKNIGLFRAGCIYALKCPNTDLVRYIGKTFDLKNRIRQHFKPQDDERTNKDNWVRSLKKQGKQPIVEVLDTCDEFDWSKKEIAYIKLYKSFGANLLNHTLGGEQGALNYTFNDEQRKKVSKALKGKKKSEEHKLNSKKALAEKFKNDNLYREKMQAIARKTLLNMTEEQKEKSRIARRIGRCKKSSLTICKYVKIGIAMSTGMSKINSCKLYDVHPSGLRGYCIKRNLKEHKANV